MIGVGGPAHADPDAGGTPDGTDSAAFLDSLQAAGITYSRRDLAITTAEAVCRLVGNGRSGPEVVAVLQTRNPGLTPEHAAQFLAIALRSYCPNQLAPSHGGGAE
ncbi:MAG: DUF732 domain-containing protein [Mycobacterium sp.]